MPSGVYRRTEEHIRKLRGRHWKLSEETKKKLSIAFKGKKRPPFSEEHRRKLSEAKKGGKCYWYGKHRSEEIKKKMSEAEMGEKNHNWQGGISSESTRIRMGIDWRLWREAVFARDNWTCQKCKKKGGKLTPHHIQNFAQYPELRFAIDNGITFCEKCHRIFHRQFGIKNNNIEQIKLFLKHRLKNK